MAWSFESDKLAVATSDGLVLVYRLGVEWNSERKKLINKYPSGTVTSSVTHLCWPVKRPHQLIFTCSDGSVILLIENWMNPVN